MIKSRNSLSTVYISAIILIIIITLDDVMLTFSATESYQNMLSIK